MRYKGQYKPSYLLDAEAATWEPIEKCAPLLDKTAFVPFHKALMDGTKEMESTPANGVDSISNSANCLRSVLAIFSGMLAPITVSFCCISIFPNFGYLALIVLFRRSFRCIIVMRAFVKKCKNMFRQLGKTLPKKSYW